MGAFFDARMSVKSGLVHRLIKAEGFYKLLVGVGSQIRYIGIVSGQQPLRLGRQRGSAAVLAADPRADLSRLVVSAGNAAGKEDASWAILT